MLLLAPGLAFGQDTGTIEGTVIDAATGESLPGATVQVLEEGIGSATDDEGRYTIESVPAGDQRLRVQFVGYEVITRSVEVPGGETITQNFELEQETAQLDEVVVSGYRPETDRVEAGATSGISGEDVELSGVESTEGSLQGRAAGVRVLSESGQPGAGFSVNVRGAISVNAGTDPLYIVDGVQVNKEDNLSFGNGNPLSSLNPNDIESIQVLKDASAAAIYGAQAANGVVVIETKSGQAGDTQINFGTQLGTRSEITPFDPMTTEEYFSFQDEALNNALQSKVGVSSLGALTGGALTARSLHTQLLGPDSIQTDWKDAVFRQGFTQSYNASVSGGNSDTQFRLSGRFTRNEAQSISSQFRQGQIRAKVDHRATDYVSVTGNVNAATNVYQGVNEGAVNVNSPFFAIYQVRPNQPIYNEPGNASSGFNLPGGVFPNPVAQQEFNTRRSEVNSFNASVEADWTLPGNFGARSFAGTQYEDVAEPFFGDPRIPANADEGGNGIFVTQRDISFNVSQSFSWDRTFDNVHRVSTLAGSELRRVKERFSQQDGEQFPNELLRTLSSAGEPTNVSTSDTQYRQLSFFGNGSYTYDNTYQLSGTLRYDGNSRFGADNRWGVFWTTAAYWRLSNEAFLEDADFLSNLKLRASYGITGNSDGIGDFQSLQQFSGAGEYNGFPGIRPTNIGNPELSWEEKESINVGLDYGLFDGRISGSVDFFQDDRNELLLFRDLPLDSGFGSILENIGSIRVRGADIALSTVNVDDWNGFSWTTDFNVSFQGAEVKELLPDDGEITQGLLTYREGEAPAELTLVRYGGVNPANGRPMYLDANGDLTYVPNDPNDEKLVGNTNPDFFGGLTNTFNFKGLTVSAFVQYDYGRRAFTNDIFFTNIGAPFLSNKSEDLVDRWKEPGDVTRIPKAYGSVFSGTLSNALGVALPSLQTYPDGTSEQQGIATTRFLDNASYVRLKEVRINYDFPSSVLDQVDGLRSLSVFVQGSNLITWTEYNGVEVESVGSVVSTTFPQARSFTAGINVGL